MISPAFKAKAYLKDGCPFSFRFWLFMVEARLDNQIDVIRCNEAAPDFERTKQMLSTALGKPASFPTVEVESGHYQSDSDALIQRYAAKAGIDPKRLALLTFYEETILPPLKELHSREAHGG